MLVGVRVIALQLLGDVSAAGLLGQAQGCVAVGVSEQVVEGDVVAKVPVDLDGVGVRNMVEDRVVLAIN